MSATITVPFNWNARYLPPRARAERTATLQDLLPINLRSAAPADVERAFLVADVGERSDNALFAPTPDQRPRNILSSDGGFWRAIGSVPTLQAMIDADFHLGDGDAAEAEDPDHTPLRRSLNNPFMLPEGSDPILQAVSSHGITTRHSLEMAQGPLRSWDASDLGLVGGAVRRRGADLMLVGETVYQRCSEPVWTVSIDTDTHSVSVGIGPFEDIPDPRYRTVEESDARLMVLRFRLNEAEKANATALAICASLGWERAMVSAKARVFPGARCLAPTEAANAAAAGRLVLKLGSSIREMPRAMALEWARCRDCLRQDDQALSRPLARDLASLAAGVLAWSRQRISTGIFEPPTTGTRQTGGLHPFVPAVSAAVQYLADGHGCGRPSTVDWLDDGPVAEWQQPELRRRPVTTTWEAVELSKRFGLDLQSAAEAAQAGEGDIWIMEHLHRQPPRVQYHGSRPPPPIWTPLAVSALVGDQHQFGGDPAHHAALVAGRYARTASEEDRALPAIR